MHSLGGLVGLSLEEGDDARLVVLVVVEHLAKSAAMAVENLALLAFDEAQLHVAVDGLAAVRRADSRQQTPLLVDVEAEADDLTGSSQCSSSNGYISCG